MPGTVRLQLTAGEFVVRMDDGNRVQTCYTDRTGTSRTAVANLDDILAFARDVLAKAHMNSEVA
jgi:hypothetical protein